MRRTRSNIQWGCMVQKVGEGDGMVPHAYHTSTREGKMSIPRTALDAKSQGWDMAHPQNIYLTCTGPSTAQI